MMKKSVFYEAMHDKENQITFFEGNSNPTPPHFHRCIEILYLLDGSVKSSVDDETFLATKDDILFVRRCAVHALEPDRDFRDYVLIVKTQFSDDFASMLEKETLPALLSDKEFNRKLLPIFQEMARKETQDSFLLTKGYIDLLFGKLLSHYERRKIIATPNLSTVVAALNYIDEQYQQSITLDSIASHFGYTKYYFSRLFNQYIGDNLNNYINMIRINNVLSKAKKDETANLCDLVFACGFDSMATFYRNFSKYYSVSPAQYLKTMYRQNTR